MEEFDNLASVRMRVRFIRSFTFLLVVVVVTAQRLVVEVRLQFLDVVAHYLVVVEVVVQFLG